MVMASDGGGGGTLGQSSTQKQDQAKKKDLYDAAAERVASKGTATTKSSNDPLVYLGQSDMLMGEMRFATPGQYDKTATLTSTANQYYGWDSKTKNKFLTQLNLAGYDTTQMKDAQIAALWGGYAQQAASYYQEGRGQKLTPWDILTKDMEQRESYVKTPRSVTQTSTSYDMSTQQDAHAIFMQAAQSLLGRDPTKSEVATFQRAVNAYEKANPTVTTATTNYMGDEVTGQTSTTTGGVKEGARSLLAMEDVKADPEYGAYQAATNGMNWLMEMVGG